MYAIFTNDLELIKLANSKGAQVVPLNDTAAVSDIPVSNDKRTEILISDFLSKTLKIPVEYSGFTYLKTIFEKSLTDADFERQPLLSVVYSYCSKGNNTSISQIDRAIRYAIHFAHNNRNIEKYFEIFNTHECCNASKFIRTSINYFKTHIV